MQAWELLDKLERHLKNTRLPSVSQIADQKNDPFAILISTIISLRTKDEVTIPAAQRLLNAAATPYALAQLAIKKIAALIYPAGFYKTKAVNIKKTAQIIAENYNSQVPDSMEELLNLPGVGRKTANLVRNLGFNLPGICVDTHVHRISNRLGWVQTKNPAKTEIALMRILPQSYWIGCNETLVKFGKTICTPISPFCSRCPVADNCARICVETSR